jgi:hypothetical protein
MKAIYVLTILLLLSPFLYAQPTVKADTIKPAKGNVDKQLDNINERKTKLHSDSLGNQPLKSALIDKSIYNRYGDLLVDDTMYNKKYPLWRPAVQTLGALTFTWAIDRFVFQADYAHIGPSTWKENTYRGVYRWEWDNDRFGINFIGHPYSGALSYNTARCTGYNYYQSFGFAVGGSLMWEYFGENTHPSYNDIMNTPISGAFLGEVLYRLSSNVLDDRTRGTERAFREIAVGIIDPVRGFNRLIQGKTFRTTNKEVYEKNPVNISLYSGIHMVNDPSQGIFGKGTNNVMINAQFDYGNPFELRSRRPFDFFKVRIDANFGVGRKFVDNVIGSGILFGKNLEVGKISILVGGFQYYDYWDSKMFELGAIGFGGGVDTKLPITNSVNLYTRIHLAVMPLAGNSTKFGPDTSQFKDYSYGDGLEGKFECMLNFGKYVNLSMIYYYYMVHTYAGGLPGDNYISILKPRITVNLYKFVNVGFENFMYFEDRYLKNSPGIFSMRSEQKIFLLIYLQDSQRRGEYN